jgi:hypothetical protein
MRKRALVLAVIMFVGPFASFAPIGWLFFRRGARACRTAARPNSRAGFCSGRTRTDDETFGLRPRGSLSPEDLIR